MGGALIGGSGGFGGLFGKAKKTGGGYGESQVMFEQLKGEFMSDPYLSSALQMQQGMAQTDWLSQGKSAGRAMGMQQADLQSSQLQSALAARGGGNISSALQMGAATRIGAQQTSMQGLQQGFGMQQQAIGGLTSAAATRMGLIGNLYASLMGVAGKQVGKEGQLGTAQISGQAGIWQALIGAAGGMAGPTPTG